VLALGCGGAPRPTPTVATRSCEDELRGATQALRTAEGRDAAATPARLNQLRWLAQHCATLDQTDVLRLAAPGPAPATLVAAWQAQVEAHPDDATVLGNAATLLGYGDEGALALYARAEAAAPTDPRWPTAQAWIYRLDAEGGADATLAAKAYAKFERAAALSDDAARFDLLGDLAGAAFAAGQPVLAKQYAEKNPAQNAPRPTTRKPGNLIHEAHVTLGHVALAAGDVATAKAELLEAGKTPGSPQLNSFGPDMTLAAALLERGERDVVVAYFDLCERFWDMGKDELDVWRAQLARGETPRLR